MNEKAGRRSGVKAAISYFLSFLCCFFSACFMLCVVFQVTILNQKTFMKQSVKNHYSDYALQAVQTEFASYGLASGFDEKFCESLVGKDEVSADVSQNISYLYRQDASEPDYDKLETAVYQKLIQNVKSRKLALNAETDQSVRFLAKSLTLVYKNHVSFPPVLTSVMRSLIPKATKIIPVLEIILLLLTALCVFLLLRLNHRRGFLRFCIYASTGTAVLYFLSGAVTLLSGKIEKIGIVEQSLYAFATGYARQIVIDLFIVSGTMAVITAALTAAYIHRCRKHTEEYDLQHAKGVYKQKLIQ